MPRPLRRAGREAEVERLLGKVRALASCRGSGVVTVSGSPSLLDAALAVADQAGVLAASARCTPAEADLPYAMVSQLAATLRGVGHRLAVCPLRRSAAPAAAVSRLCAEFLALATRHPLLLTVEGLEWADPGSRRWWRAMTGRVSQAPLLLVACEESDRARVEPVIGRLPDDALALVRAMAVCGEVVDFDVVAALAAPRTLPVPAALELLVRLGLAVDGTRPRLADGAVAAGVLEAMTVTERAALARRAAELGRDAAIPDEHVAELLTAAPAVHGTWVVPLLRRVAARRLAAGGRGAATALLTRALREDAGTERPALLVDLALATGGRAADARLEQALLEAGADVPEEVLVRAADLLACGGNTPAVHRAVAAHRRRNAPGADGSAALAALGRLAVEDSATDPVLPALPALPELPEVSADPVVAGVLAWRLAARGRRRTRARELAATALRATGPATPFAARIHACRALRCAGDLDQAVRGLDQVLVDARRLNARTPAALALLERARVELGRGNPARAGEDVDSARAEVPFETLHPRLRAAAVAVDAARRLAAEQVESAERLLTAELPAGAADGAGWAGLQFVRGSLRMALADPRGALPYFLDCGRGLAARGWNSPALSHWRSMAALAHSALGDTAAAARLVRDALDRARRWGAPATLGHVHLLAARAGGEGSTAHLAQAVSLLGGTPFASAARSAAPPVFPPGAGRLAEGEERIAVLAAAGLANPEIARHLSVSTRTVEARLTGVYRKLALTGRRQLAEMLRPSPPSAVVAELHTVDEERLGPKHG
ncbi:hypothetical protein BU204_17715 [Actinophytocola xanthii]|uniref:HTH luxR-type domain-containing protein n=1 Tax=Actinophytocola xanthii TaxID=1912961 RepID=A0A1Q8CPB9_9PSEU|nr:hypothetical protein BU204_17715 [Actinophytocola xanthii]